MFIFNTTVDTEVKWFIALTPQILLPFVFATPFAADATAGRLMHAPIAG